MIIFLPPGSGRPKYTKSTRQVSIGSKLWMRGMGYDKGNVEMT